VAYRDMFSSVDLKLPNTSAPPSKVVFRVQNTWVPVADDGTTPRKIVPAHKSYQTSTRDDPCNLLVVGTPEGIFVHADEPGVHKLMAHRVPNSSNTINEHWFAATASDDLVGNASSRVEEGANEKNDEKKKTRKVAMGLEGTGARSNCFFILSIPRKQTSTRPTPPPHWSLSGNDGGMPVYRSLDGVMGEWEEEDDLEPVYRSFGKSRAAIVGVDESQVHSIVAPHDHKMKMVRDESVPMVATLIYYNTIHGGKDVGPVDLAAAVTDMERIYDRAIELGGARCRLSQLPACLHKLEAAHMQQIHTVLSKNEENDVRYVPTTNALAAFA